MSKSYLLLLLEVWDLKTKSFDEVKFYLGLLVEVKQGKPNFKMPVSTGHVLPKITFSPFLVAIS